MNAYAANITAITRTDAALARTVNNADPPANLVIETSRDGCEVVGLRDNGHVRLFHSKYHARRDAERLAESAGDAGLIVAIGIGSGWHIRAALEAGKRVLVVEPNPGLLRAGLGGADLSTWLEFFSLRITTATTAAEVAHHLGATFIPALDRGLVVLPLRARLQADPDHGEQIVASVSGAVDALRADLATQARHGLRWTRNTLINLTLLPDLRLEPLPSLRGSSVVVAAAGPSLTGISAFRSQKIVAVDSALPSLSALGIVPDLALTIDCQIASYHHYLGKLGRRVAVVADLSAAPSLMATFGSSTPMRTDMPLHTLLASLGLGLPYLSVTSGTVTHAAVELTDRLGAESITLVGADFSYPNGESYARDSYIHRDAGARATRCAPLAGRHYRFIAERPSTARDPKVHTRWRQPGLDQFAVELARLAGGLRAEFLRVDADAPPLPVQNGRVTSPITAETETVLPNRDRIERILGTTLDLIRPLDRASRLRDALAGPDPLPARALLPTLTWYGAQRSSEGDPVATVNQIVGNLIERAMEKLKARS